MITLVSWSPTWSGQFQFNDACNSSDNAKENIAMTSYRATAGTVWITTPRLLEGAQRDTRVERS